MEKHGEEIFSSWPGRPKKYVDVVFDDIETGSGIPATTKMAWFGVQEAVVRWAIAERYNGSTGTATARTLKRIAKNLDAVLAMIGNPRVAGFLAGGPDEVLNGRHVPLLDIATHMATLADRADRATTAGHKSSTPRGVLVTELVRIYFGAGHDAPREPVSESRVTEFVRTVLALLGEDLAGVVDLVDTAIDRRTS